MNTRPQGGGSRRKSSASYINPKPGSSRCLQPVQVRAITKPIRKPRRGANGVSQSPLFDLATRITAQESTFQHRKKKKKKEYRQLPDNTHIPFFQFTELHVVTHTVAFNFSQKSAKAETMDAKTQHAFKQSLVTPFFFFNHLPTMGMTYLLWAAFQVAFVSPRRDANRDPPAIALSDLESSIVRNREAANSNLLMRDRPIRTTGWKIISELCYDQAVIDVLRSGSQ